MHSLLAPGSAISDILLKSRISLERIASALFSPDRAITFGWLPKSGLPKTAINSVADTSRSRSKSRPLAT